MKKYILLSVLFCGMVSAACAQIKIQGTVRHYNNENIYLSYWNGKSEQKDTLRIGKNGKFTYYNDLNIPEFLNIAGKNIPLYMAAGNQLQISINLHRKQSIVFKGDHANENNYLYALFELSYLQEWLKSVGYMPFHEFQAQIDEKKHTAQKMLKNITDEKLQKKWTQRQNLAPLYLGLGYYDIISRTDRAKANADNDFSAFIQGIDLTDRTQVDYNIISQVINWHLGKSDSMDTRHPSVRYLEMTKKIITDESGRNEHVTQYMKHRLKGEKNTDIQEVFNKYKTVCTDTAAIAECQEKLHLYMNYFNLKNGVTAPDFEMLDPNGKKVRLSDFRGKMLYIDVWATWCAPCKAEIPHVAALHKQFINDDRIEFISISVDTKTKTWKKMIEEDRPGWKQYIIDGGTNSYFYKEYAIEFIPRFMLIDKNGQIAEINYIKPSVPGCAENLKKLLEK